MTRIDDVGRPEPEPSADEITTLLGFLDFQRATLAWKCAGLDPAGLRGTVGVSSMTLGGVLKHMAYVEEWWFSRSLHGNDTAPPWDAVDWAADPDWEWHSADHDTPEQLRQLWNGCRRTFARARGPCPRQRRARPRRPTGVADG